MYQQYIVYEPHAKIVLDILERKNALEADFYALCRELETRPVLFPQFETWVDTRNMPKKWPKESVRGISHLRSWITHVAEINRAQEAILTERLDIQQSINAFKDKKERQKAKTEAAPDLERLRQKSINLDILTAELKSQLPTIEKEVSIQDGQTKNEK